MKRSRPALALLATCVVGLAAARAQTVWTSNSDQRWSQNSNWSGNNRPNTDTEIAVFGSGTQHTVELDNGSYSVGGITFDSNAASYLVTDDNGSRTLKLGGPSASYAYVQQNSANDQTIDIGTLAVKSPTMLDTPGAGRLTIASVFTGTDFLEKTSTGGDVVLTGNSRNFAGEIYITAGTLQAGHRNALGDTTGTTTVSDGGTLAIGGTSNLSIGESISLAGQGANGNGALHSIANTNTVSGLITLAADTRIESAAGNLKLSGGISGAGQTVTFGGSGNITVIGTLATGAGGIVKDGAGDLRLANPGNAFSGPSTINAGRIVAQDDGVIDNAAALLIGSGATLDLASFGQTIGSLEGAGTLDLGNSGTGSLTLTSGSGIFSGNFVGKGTIVIGAGATLTLAADFNAPNIDFTLAGGTLAFESSTSTFGDLKITGNSILDFGNTTASVLTFAKLSFQNTSVQLTVQNWVGLSDYFYAQTFTGAAPDTPIGSPQNQISFSGYLSNSSIWHSSDHQITPAPEPATYGLLLLASSLGLTAWRSRRRRASEDGPQRTEG